MFRRILFNIWLFLNCSILIAGEYKITGEATFKADAVPGFLKINGEGGKVTGSAVEKDGLINGEFKVLVKDFKTGISLRDDHMHNKFMESEKFPDIVVKLTDYKKGNSEFKGMITFHGVTKPLLGKVQIEGDKIFTDFELNVKDFDVSIPNYAGVTMKDVLKASAKLTYSEIK